MSKKIVVVSNKINDAQMADIREIAGKYQASVAFYGKNSEAIPNLEDADIIYGFGPDLIENAPNLKWFCSSSAGIDKYAKSEICVKREREDGLIVTNSSGSYGKTIAEHIIMMALIMMRRLPEYQELLSTKTWRNDLDNVTLFRSNIVVLGTGDLGETFATRVRGFQPASLIGISRSGNPNPAFDAVYTMEELPKVVENADLLVMCLPGTPETIGVLSEALIDKLPDSAYVVNVGRGSAVDEEALIKALNEGRLAGAALDVFGTEPLPEDSPLWNVEKLYITSHISGQETNEWTKDNNFSMFCEDLENYFEGRPMAHLASLEMGY